METFALRPVPGPCEPARRRVGAVGIALALLALPAPTVLPAERLPFRHFAAASGLAGESIRDLLLDSHGFLWIATSSGLSRFDGQQFRNYDTSHGLPTPRVDALAETAPPRVGRLRDLPRAAGELVEIDHASGLPVAAMNEIVFGREGVWVASRLGVLQLSADGARRIDVRNGLPDSNQTAALEDGEGNLWLGTESRGLVRLPPSGFLSYGSEDGLADDRISSIFERAPGGCCPPARRLSISPFSTSAVARSSSTKAAITTTSRPMSRWNRGDGSPSSASSRPR